MLKLLLTCPQVSFLSSTLHDLPDESGIYLFSDRKTSEALYVGKTDKGIRSRAKDHWDGYTNSDLAKKLVKLKIVSRDWEGRVWIKENVSVRWLTERRLGMRMSLAEHFAIGALRPEFNDR